MCRTVNDMYTYALECPGGSSWEVYVREAHILCNLLPESCELLVVSVHFPVHATRHVGAADAEHGGADVRRCPPSAGTSQSRARLRIAAALDRTRWVTRFNAHHYAATQ